jgi:hypothetical protein
MTAVICKILVCPWMFLLWILTRCRVVGRYHRFRGTYCLHLQGFSPLLMHICVVTIWSQQVRPTKSLATLHDVKMIWHISALVFLNGFHIPLCQWPRQRYNDQTNIDHKKWKNSKAWQKIRAVSLEWFQNTSPEWKGTCPFHNEDHDLSLCFLASSDFD